MSIANPVIVFALFPGVMQLDFTGPHTVFAALPGATVIRASTAGGTLDSSDGITFAGLQLLADIPHCDVICVPGGSGVTDNAIVSPIASWKPSFALSRKRTGWSLYAR